ncbi:pogo transposable [Stemphylium lycopersici]|nr:pogo transposable [Stemphylium lycopersici]
MDSIQKAIEAIELHKEGEQFSYQKVSEKFGVDRSTLARRHQGKQASYAAKAKQQQLPSPQQEFELVKYIERCSERGLAPTRDMIKNFASAMAKWEVSESWITCFLHRHSDRLTTKLSAGIDRDRHKADSSSRYKAYFNLLHSKMKEYDIDERNTYNMDEKGFFIGRGIRSKRIFSKASWAQKRRRAALQDGNREWVTLLACVCASGDALPPALIYQGTAGIQSSWVDDLMAEQHQVFVANSPTGWTNNELGLAWLQQPLDVVLFSPLSRHYTSELNRNLQRSQGITRVTKRDFYSNFWPAWSSTMTRDSILQSFRATGVWPMEADAVLKRFNNHPQQDNIDPEIGEHIEAKQLAQSLHSLQVNNELLHTRLSDVEGQLNTKSKRHTRSTTLATQDSNKPNGGAVFLSPRKLRECREREATKHHEAEQLQLQKLRDRDLKAAATLYKKQQAEAAKAARLRAKEERDQAKKQRAAELAERRTLKKQQRDAATTQKSRDRGNSSKRKASNKSDQNIAKRRRAVAATSQPDAGPAVASPPPKISARGRKIKTPARYR